jgi:tetratricopeptide (TPR) repeat protein
MNCPAPQAAAPEATPQDTRALLLEALRLHQTNDFAAAAGLYRRALAQNPEQPDGNRLYGTLCLQSGCFDEAERHLRRALAVAPADAETHSNLGAVLIHAGRLAEAIPSLQAAIALRPGFADALSNLGEALRQTGEAAGARAALEQALAANPDHANALFNLGVLKAAERDYAGATQSLERALALFPGHVAARRQLANIYITVGNYPGAERLCRDLLAHNPDDHEVRVTLASIFIAARQYDEALLQARHVIEREPDHVRARICLGHILRQSGNMDEAMAIFQEVAASHPEEPGASAGIVEVLLRRGELDAALALVEKVVSHHPEYGLACLDMGTVLEKLGRAEDACNAYRAGLARLPDQPALHFNLGNQLLLLGRFEEGWKEYDWRTKLAAWGIRDANCKAWDGEPLAGKSLLLEAEQGLGDMIQFVRLAPLVAAQGANVLLECQPELVRLLESATGIQRIVPKPCHGEVRPDLRMPLLSLPGLLGIRLENLPAKVPYLAAPADLAAAWKDRLAGQAGLRVGIAWAGNPQHIDDANRSCPPELLAPLLAVPGAAFYSLQKGGKAVATGIQDHSGEWRDFADTAAFMQALDLVITVDTAIAHLAGALGMPVWTLLPYAPDWRWLLERSDSPWYPTMRLFRQAKPRAWRSLVGEAADALAEEISSRTSQRR